jgi:hypothetical protein
MVAAAIDAKRTLRNICVSSKTVKLRYGNGFVRELIERYAHFLGGQSLWAQPSRFLATCDGNATSLAAAESTFFASSPAITAGLSAFSLTDGCRPPSSITKQRPVERCNYSTRATFQYGNI